MVGSGILPVALHQKKLYFLFGRENIYERSSPGWADFGGGVNPGESIWKSAVREAHEESTGMIGDEATIDSRARTTGGVYPISKGTYHTHLMHISYDPNLPDRFQFNHDLIWDKLDSRKLQSSRVFEKDKIQWFTLADLRRKRRQFRVFFRPILDDILNQAESIRAFMRRAEARTARPNVTRKRSKISSRARVPVAKDISFTRRRK